MEGGEYEVKMLELGMVFPCLQRPPAAGHKLPSSLLNVHINYWGTTKWPTFSCPFWQKIKKEWKREHRISKGGMFYLCPMVWFPFAFFGLSAKPLPHSRGSMATATFSFGPLLCRPKYFGKRRGWWLLLIANANGEGRGQNCNSTQQQRGKTEISMASFPSPSSRLNFTFYSFLPPASIEAAGSSGAAGSKASGWRECEWRPLIFFLFSCLSSVDGRPREIALGPK
jgi:hypothetical protein